MAINILYTSSATIPPDTFLSEINDDEILLNGQPIRRHELSYSILRKQYPYNTNEYHEVSIVNREKRYLPKCVKARYIFWEIDGVVPSDLNDLIVKLKDALKVTLGITPPTTPYITSTLPMIDPLGVFVIKNTYSDGTVTYTLQDGSPYLGDTTLLLPYTAPELAPILFSYTPPQLANGQSDIVDVPVIGAILGNGYITLTTNLTAFQNTSVNAFVIADDLVRIIIVNNTGGTINLPTLDFKYIK